MKRSILVLILFPCFISIVFGQSKSSNDIKYWIRNDYLECLEKKLPCECPDNNLSLFFDNNPYHIIHYRLDTIDSLYFQNIHRIINFKNGETISFEIIDILLALDNNKDSLKAHIEIKSDTLFYYQYRNNIQYIFTPIKMERLLNIEDIYCLNYLNKLLVSNGYNELREILKSDELHCDCDIQFGINRIHNNEKVWIVKIVENELIIYNWKYPEEMGMRAKSSIFKQFILNDLTP